MALFTSDIVKSRMRRDMSNLSDRDIHKLTQLTEAMKIAKRPKSYDIFLSHSSKDKDLIIGMKLILEDHGYNVYVDWLNDPQLDRGKVNKSTAQTLKERMRISKSLFYVTSSNAEFSKWMPWECGYFDGYKDKVAIVPVTRDSGSKEFEGQEYLGLYPYCTREKDLSEKWHLWINKDKNNYTYYDLWVKSQNNNISWMGPK